MLAHLMEDEVNVVTLPSKAMFYLTAAALSGTVVYSEEMLSTNKCAHLFKEIKV